MAKKEFIYRGKTIEELAKMDLKEFVKYIPARSRRSLLRGRSHQQEMVLKAMKEGKSPKTHARDMVIVPEMIGKVVNIHSGKEWMRVEITPDMIGHILGEFALTRKKLQHSAPGIGATKSSSNVSVK